MWLYDLFICHASEDKEAVVRPLASRLREAHLDVWYDEFTLKIGDSLRRSIDRGLARSRFAVVVLSQSFFAKNWPQRELDGLVARETASGEKVVLPVWHGVARDEVLGYSPPLADALAADSAEGLEAVTERILRVAKPRPSPLVVARDYLHSRSLNPPTVTDEWWLDVVEASNREHGWGFALQREHWGRWSFPLPPDGETPEERGERLAWVAMQLVWTKDADARLISQITHPRDVLAFLREHEGLAEVAAEFPSVLATYAPQLTIPSFGEEFEPTFDELLETSVREHEGRSGGEAITVDGAPPRCDFEIALRHPEFGGYDPPMLACHFVQGDLGGPSPKLYETIDYIAWFLSEASEWMPTQHRTVLLQGLVDWPTWQWHGNPSVTEAAVGCEPYASRGQLASWLLDQVDGDSFQHTQPPVRAIEDLEARLGQSRRILDLPETPEALARRFLERDFIGGFLRDRQEAKRRREDA